MHCNLGPSVGLTVPKLVVVFTIGIEFVLFIHKNKKENSIIVLDNGDWHLNAYEFLRKHYYCLDYLRIEDAELTETSVFFHKRVINKSMI